MEWVFLVVMVLWSLGNLVVAFVEPPPFVRRFFPGRIAALFSFIPSPFDRIIGFSFNAAAGFFLVYLYVTGMF